MLGGKSILQFIGFGRTENFLTCTHLPAKRITYWKLHYITKCAQGKTPSPLN